MKRIVLLILLFSILLIYETSIAAKARSISTDNDSIYHSAHLKSHLGESTCYATGNHIKVRSQADRNKLVGHLEQADEFILLEIDNNRAKIEILHSAKSSPDSWTGMIGWVNSDYIECTCSTEAYVSSSFSDTVLSSPFPYGMPDGWSHSSGVGAWSTELRIKQDGSFFGYFHDADMGDSRESYPNGIRYECLFFGRFADIQQIDSGIYSMRVTEFDIINESLSQFIYDGVLHIIMNPGIHVGDEFIIYSPGVSKQHISEEHLSRLHGIITDPLSRFVLCNMSNDIAFDPGSDYPQKYYFPSSDNYFCTANNLRIRNAPNGSEILGHLEKDDSFVVNGIVDGWANIIVINPYNSDHDSWPGLSGWVNMKYLKKN